MKTTIKFLIAQLRAALTAVLVLTAVCAPFAGRAQGIQADSADDVQAEAALPQLQKLAAFDGAASDAFGWSVAISGNTAVVGSPLSDVNGKKDQGVAYVYVYNNGAWATQARLVAPDIDVNRQFGYAVAIDGDTVVVGARSPNQIGAAYVFIRSGVSWFAHAKLVPADEMNDERFGAAVAVSADTIVVGAPLHDIAGTPDKNRGAAYVFTRTGATWAQQAKLTAGDAQDFQFFGDRVAVDANTALVGAPGGSGSIAFDPGSVYAFTRTGTAWSQQAKLLAFDAEHNQRFGVSLSLSGETAAIGAVSATVEGTSLVGAAYIFVRSGGSWFAQAKLVADDHAKSSLFGIAVSLKNDAVVVGASGSKIGEISGQGAAYLFKRTGTTWSQQAKLTATDGAAKDAFGNAVAIDAELILAGTPQKGVASANDVTTTQPGAAYVFSTAPDDGLPKIQGVGVLGKKLVVTGIHFDAPTEIYVDGQRQKKTFNDEASPATSVVARKAGKFITPGTTVMVQVRNSNSGTVSNQFLYTRPLQ